MKEVRYISFSPKIVGEILALYRLVGEGESMIVTLEGSRSETAPAEPLVSVKLTEGAQTKPLEDLFGILCSCLDHGDAAVTVKILYNAAAPQFELQKHFPEVQKAMREVWIPYFPGKSLRGIAQLAGVSGACLSAWQLGQRKPSARTLDTVYKSLQAHKVPDQDCRRLTKALGAL